MDNVAIRVESLVKTYGRGSAQVRAVDGLTFTVARGAIFGLLGPNGAGKTTTLRVLTTLLRPSSGTATVCGFDVLHKPLEVRRRIAVVVQEQAAELLLNVRDNLLTFARFHGRTGAEVARRASAVIEQLQLADVAHRKVQDLSGGVRRRVQVAKMFMVDVPVVFLDEFSTGMDPVLKRHVIDLLRQESVKGRTIVLTTHILSEAEALCDDILIVDKGRAVARGDVQTLKLLSERVYDVTISFDRPAPKFQDLVAEYRPQQVAVTGATVQLRVKDDEHRVLDLVAKLAARGRVVAVEVTGASLEDVFVELTSGSGA